MLQFSTIIEDLIQSLRCLPSIGPKSAQRMALNLLEHNQHNARILANNIHAALEKVRHCDACRMLTEDPLCPICQNPARDERLICVVESPADVFAIEQTAHYKGRYFILSGHLSPLDGIGPKDIGIPELLKRCQEHDIREIILATNPTVEGEATAQYIASMLINTTVSLSRIAHGVPMGGELEYLDGNTLTQAFNARQSIQSHQEDACTT